MFPVIDYEFKHKGQAFRSSHWRFGNYSLRKRVGAEAVTARYAFGKTGNITIVAVPDELRKPVKSARADLVARIADVDDEVAGLYLSIQHVPSATLKAAIGRATIANRFVPVFGVDQQACPRA